MLPDLNQLLEYQNPAVLKLYEQNYPNNKLSAHDAFQEVLKYLWLSRKHGFDLQELNNKDDVPKELFMPRSMSEIDEMWHEFILFTEDYMDFCAHYFGQYMHHLPNIFDTRPLPRDAVEQDIAKMLPYIYDNLGESTVRVWFASYLDE